MPLYHSSDSETDSSSLSSASTASHCTSTSENSNSVSQSERSHSPDYDSEAEIAPDLENSLIDSDIQISSISENSSSSDFEDMNSLRRSVRLSSRSQTSSSSSGSSTRRRCSRNNLSRSSTNNHTSDTEEYEVDTQTTNPPPIIEINDTQEMDAAAGTFGNIINDDDDDDLIMIPEVIETIDLCTQAFLTPRNFRQPVSPNEVIEIADSPLTQQATTSNTNGPVRNRRANHNNKSPYQKPTSSSNQNRFNFNDSQDDNKSVKISCPICLESVIGRQPVSTICGHVFCKPCIIAALSGVKKCPMCKRTLKAGNFHDIFLGA